MEKKRKGRFERRRNPASFVVTKLVLDILTHLSKYHCLRTSALYGLLPHINRDYLLRRLESLHSHGYIDRLKTHYGARYAPVLHSLSEKGEQFLISHGVQPDTIVSRYRKEQGTIDKELPHTLMVCDTLASIEIGARNRFIPWSQIVLRTTAEKPMRLPYSIRHTFEGGRVETLEKHAVPDGIFGLRYNDGKASFFALEAEHYSPIDVTTLKRSSFLRKVLAYQNIIKTQVYKDQLKIPNMRVLVVAPTAKQLEGKIALVERLVGKSNLFLFNVVPVQEELLKAPPPFPQLFNSLWFRAGLPPIRIDTGEEMVQ